MQGTPTRNIFLSYSRNELYFAEYLAINLQSFGHNVWFDLQQLEPGSDWLRDIEEALHNAHTILVVVSQASLRSPYVEAEWRYALNNGKQVVLALFEAVRLPLELQDAIRIDCRGRFQPALMKISAAIDGTLVKSDPLPNVLPFPTRLPPHVAITLVVVLLQLLPALAFAGILIWGIVNVLTSPLQATAVMILLLASFAAIRIEWRVLKRQVPLWNVADSLSILNALWLMFVALGLLISLSTQEKPYGFMFFLVFLGGLAFYTRWSVNKSPDWLRFAPRGPLPFSQAEARFRYNPAAQESTPINTAKRTFCVAYAEADKAIAIRVIERIKAADHIFVPLSKHRQNKTQPNYGLLILSNYTRPETVTRLQQVAPERILTIVVSSFAPRDEAKDLWKTQLSKLQAFDYRRLNDASLTELAHYLASTDAEQVLYSRYVAPENFDTIVLPPPIEAASVAFNWIGTVLLLVALYVVTALAFAPPALPRYPGQSSDLVRDILTENRIPVVIMVFVIVSVASFVVSTTLKTRTLSRRGFVIALMVLAGLVFGPFTLYTFDLFTMSMFALVMCALGGLLLFVLLAIGICSMILFLLPLIFAVNKLLLRGTFKMKDWRKVLFVWLPTSTTLGAFGFSHKIFQRDLLRQLTSALVLYVLLVLTPILLITY